MASRAQRLVKVTTERDQLAYECNATSLSTTAPGTRAKLSGCTILGLEELRKPADLAARGGCWFRCGAHQIHIGVEDDFRPAKKAHPALELAHRGKAASGSGVRHSARTERAQVHFQRSRRPGGKRRA